MLYRVSDNSFCINLENNIYTALVQEHNDYYSPDIKEDGAIFKIVSKPYDKDINEHGIKYGIKTFIEIKSNKTGNIYRVLYNKHCIYK